MHHHELFFCGSKPKLIISMNMSDLASHLHDAKYFVPPLTCYVFSNKNIKNDNIHTQQQETHLFMCKEKIKVRLKSLHWVLLSGKGMCFPMCRLCMDTETVNDKICYRSTYTKKILFRHDCSHMCYSKCKEDSPPSALPPANSET